MGYCVKKDFPALEIATNITIQLDPRDLKYSTLIQRRLLGQVLNAGTNCKWNVHGKELRFHIADIIGNSDSPYKRATQQTQYQFEKLITKSEERHDEQDIYLTALKDIISSSLENASSFNQLNIPITKSILIHGVPGVGKTRLLQQVADIFSYSVYEISGYEMLSFDEEEYDFAEFLNYNPLTLLVNKAIKTGKSIIVIDNLDAFTAGGDKTKKVLEILTKEVDKISKTHSVFLVGMAHELRKLPEPLKKSDIFRQHMTLPIPSVQQRKALLKYMLADINLKRTAESMEDTTEYFASQISVRTSGYVARDLKLLIRQATLKSLRNTADIADQLDKLSLGDSSQPSVQWSDFEYAIETYRPSQRSEVESILPKRDWSELGGYHKLKDKMRQSILLPLSEPHVFTRLGVKPSSGMLLYGPSGCGKTAFVQALISESMMNVISIKGPEIFSKYLGETENKIRNIFATAKRISPCIIFIDEMDAIGCKRGFDMGESGGGVNERVLSTLLNEMDGVEGRQGVVVIGCTNRPDQIDDAILRPGRLDQLLYMGLPTLEDRLDIIKTILKRISVSEDVIPEAIAQETEFCSGADLENIFREAGTVALRQDINIEEINNSHIQAVILDICEKACNHYIANPINDHFFQQ